MKHLADNQIATLANKIISKATFSRDDELAMLHISACNECYALLKCALAVMEVTDHIDRVATLPKEEIVPSTAESSAVIKIVVLNVSAILEQLQQETAEWVFDKPFALAGARSGQDDHSDVQTVEDIDNSESFVSYDPASRRLVIQIDGRELEGIPKAYLKFSDGSTRTIKFEKCEHIYWAEVYDLSNGEYELIIEK